MASSPESPADDKFQSSIEEVQTFLSVVYDILRYESSAYDDRIFQVAWWREKNDAFRIEHRLTEQDAYDCVMRLGVQNYSHTIWEMRNNVKTRAKLFVFEGICKNLVTYVKLKIIRDGTLVCCIGFHAPEGKLRCPYGGSI